ncbi:MAG: twin-arginine translocase TatA/TatE family subunit [Bacteroidales bacterium]|jgi:TatA/E family protein of Tat protein translocase|nr:twin-arginine translocase TatA/TatE family subunit [Bacteroidales bacterium]
MPAVLLFFDISAGELMVILLVAFLVFGPSKIPEIARKIGRGMNEIRRASDEIKREITKETRKVEKEMNMEGSVYKDIKQTADEIKKDFDDVSKPFNDNFDRPAGDVPKSAPPPDMKG